MCVVYYKSIKRELKIKPIYECRCDGRLQTMCFVVYYVCVSKCVYNHFFISSWKQLCFRNGGRNEHQVYGSDTTRTIFFVSALFVARKHTFSRLTAELAALVVQEEWEKLGLQSRVDYENLKRVFERLDLKKDGRIDQHELAMIYKV